MVMRNSGPVNLDTPQGTPAVRQSNVGNVAPDVAKYASRKTIKGPSTGERVLASLLPLGQRVAENAFKEQLEEKYLEGVQAAAEGRSEEELDTNPITSDWTKAGYRDTAGRLAVSKQQAELRLDLPKLVQGTPEDFAKYQSEKRKPLLDQMEGMSKKQRAAMFAQLANDTVADQAKYVSGRAAWILQQEQESIQQSMTIRRSNLDAAKGDINLYTQEVNGFVGALYKDVWQNPKLTPALQQDMTRQAMEYASSSDNVAVYDALKNTVVKFGDGKEGTMMSRLSFEDQIKVDKAHRSAMDRTKAVRAGDWGTWRAATEAAWEDPNVGATETFEEVQSKAKVAVNAGILTAEGEQSLYKNFFKAKARNTDNGVLAQAFAVGDQQTLFSRNKSQEDGLKAWLKVNKDMPLPQAVQGLMVIGNNSGMDSALTKAGDFLKPAFAQLGYGDDIDPNNAQLVTNTLTALSIAEQTNPGAKSKFLQALSPEQQDLALYMSELQKEGVADPLTVTRMARAKQLQDKQTGGLRTEMVANARKEDAVAVQEIDDRQLLGTISQGAKSWFSSDAEAKKRLGTGRMWFENADRTAEVRAQGQVALAEELAILGQSNPTMSSASRQSKALASLAARTVDTESGPLVMPRGQTLQSYFGVPAYADQEYVGKAVDRMMAPASGNRLAWSIDPTNKLLFRELNGDGKVVRSGIVDPRSVAPVVQQQLDEDAAKESKQIGPGKEVSGVRYNGLNTANVEPQFMLGLRDDILKSEGVRDMKYPDGKAGESSFGVGIHQSNNHYQPPLGRDGRYTPQQINDTFMRASNDAAELAQKSMRSVGVQGEKYVRFFGELAYQSPGSARDPDLLAHIALGNKSEALAALKATAAYKNSKPDRQARYVAKLESAMR